MISKQKPLYDRVIVQRLDEAPASKLIVREVSTEKPMRARVIAVGPGRFNPDAALPANSDVENLSYRLPMTVKPGDIVLIGKFAGVVYEETNPVTFKTESYVILREDDILTVFEEAESTTKKEKK